MEDEVLHTAPDKRTNGMPRERLQRASGKAPGRAVLWAERPAHDFEPSALPAPVWGAYPKRFVEWATKQVRASPREVLHVCSGMLTRDEAPGVRVDIRASAAPDVVANGAALPFRDASFAAVLIDPPYSEEYARDLYGVDYPRPSWLLAEAARVVRQGGLIGFLHFLVPMPPAGAKVVSVHGVTQGCGYRIRAFTIFRREWTPLFDEQPTRGLAD